MNTTSTFNHALTWTWTGLALLCIVTLAGCGVAAAAAIGDTAPYVAKPASADVNLVKTLYAGHKRHNR